MLSWSLMYQGRRIHCLDQRTRVLNNLQFPLLGAGCPWNHCWRLAGIGRLQPKWCAHFLRGDKWWDQLQLNYFAKQKYVKKPHTGHQTSSIFVIKIDPIMRKIKYIVWGLILRTSIFPNYFILKKPLGLWQKKTYSTINQWRAVVVSVRVSPQQTHPPQFTLSTCACKRSCKRCTCFSTEEGWGWNAGPPDRMSQSCQLAAAMWHHPNKPTDFLSYTTISKTSDATTLDNKIDFFDIIETHFKNKNRGNQFQY